jgi:hypothetical protein
MEGHTEHPAYGRQWTDHQAAFHAMLEQHRALLARLQSIHSEYLALQQAGLAEEERRARLTDLLSREVDVLQEAAPVLEAARELLRDSQTRTKQRSSPHTDHLPSSH